MSALAHDALVYRSEAEYTAALVPFLVEGVERGHHTCAVTRPEMHTVLDDRLGPAATGVHRIDSREWYRHPARTVAGYHGIIKTAKAAGAPGVRVVGEVEFGDDDTTHAEWIRYEAVLNDVFADEAAWIVCPYDARRLPTRLVEHAAQTHPHTIDATGRRASTDYRDPHDVVSVVPLPIVGDLVGELEVADRLAPVRELAARALARLGCPAGRRAEVTVAVSELATNAIVHGRPPVLVRAYATVDAVVFEVVDHGPGTVDALAGFRPPTGVGGAGLWIARQFADRLEITPSPQGTTVRLGVSR